MTQADRENFQRGFQQGTKEQGVPMVVGTAVAIPLAAVAPEAVVGTVVGRIIVAGVSNGVGSYAANTTHNAITGQPLNQNAGTAVTTGVIIGAGGQAVGEGAVAVATVINKSNAAGAVATVPTQTAAATTEQTTTEASQVLKGSNNPTTQAAATKGSTLHSDKPGNLPDQLREKYPDTDFDFTKPGQKGQDVKVVGGTHPSEYPESAWDAGKNHGDFKPDSPGGRKTFKQDQKNKWPEPTQMLPYNSKTGGLTH